MPSRFAQGSLSGFWLHTRALSGGGKLAAGEVGPGQVKARGTFDWSHRGSDWVDWGPERCPAMVGDETVAAAPLRLGFRRNAVWS
jgi:hypothetical protein